MDYIIREIERKDNKAIENVIRECLIEFGGNREGLAWSDPNLGNLSDTYCKEGYKYWVRSPGSASSLEILLYPYFSGLSSRFLLADIV